jgi:Meckel syndrome type 1 protein
VAPAAIPGAQMTALVDAVARARQEGPGAAVAATLAHSTFGRVDLEFRQKDDGLTVTMASADPGFAPAVLAASRADTGNAGNQGTPARTPATRARVTKAGEPELQRPGLCRPVAIAIAIPGRRWAPAAPPDPGRGLRPGQPRRRRPWR